MSRIISHIGGCIVKALLVVAVSLTVVLIGGRDASAENCLDRLNSRSYSCQIKNSAGGGGSFPVSFDGGALLIAGDSYTCSCGATGTFKDPNFNASKAKWLCVKGDDFGGGPVGTVIQGSVGPGGKITNVSGGDSQGGALLFQCNLN